MSTASPLSPAPPSPDPYPRKSWSIYSRQEITAKYVILEQVGFGAYSDVYRARRISDDLTVALKEIHDNGSAIREIEALNLLRNSPNVILLHEYFWREDEDAVLVLEFFRTDLASVIAEAKSNGGSGISKGEVKKWMIQILCGVDACHRNMIVHRDLKPSNLLISGDGILKIADFGQARRVLMERGSAASTDNFQYYEHEGASHQGAAAVAAAEEDAAEAQSPSQWRGRSEAVEKAASVANTSCLATGSASDPGGDNDPLGGFSFDEADEGGEDDAASCLFTSCVGTRWFRAPELLFGSKEYGLEVDLWSLGCIFAELLTLSPLFPGSSDIDQIGRILGVLGTLTPEAWPGCARLADFGKISFSEVGSPIGVGGCLCSCHPDEISIVKKLVCYDPSARATAMELLLDEYFTKPPLPASTAELHVPASRHEEDEGHCHDDDDCDSFVFQASDSDSSLLHGAAFFT